MRYNNQRFPYDCKSHVSDIPNYMYEETVNENGSVVESVRQISDEEYISKALLNGDVNPMELAGVFNPTYLSKLQTIDELERRVDALEIKDEK